MTFFALFKSCPQQTPDYMGMGASGLGLVWLW